MRCGVLLRLLFAVPGCVACASLVGVDTDVTERAADAGTGGTAAFGEPGCTQASCARCAACFDLCKCSATSPTDAQCHSACNETHTGGTGSGGSGGSGGTGGSGTGAAGGTGGAGGAGAGASCDVPPGSACGVYPQCNCSAGKKCDFESTSETMQCQTDGYLPLGALCDADPSGCKKGSACVGFGLAVCKAFCHPSTGCGANSARDCWTVTGASGAQIPGFYVCTAGCDLSDPSSCAPGKVCAISGGFSDGIYTECFDAAGNGTGPGQCLNSAAECAPGYGCDDNYDCRRWCRVGDASACFGCTSVGMVANGVTYGICP